MSIPVESDIVDQAYISRAGIAEEFANSAQQSFEDALSQARSLAGPNPKPERVKVFFDKLWAGPPLNEVQTRAFYEQFK